MPQKALVVAAMAERAKIVAKLEFMFSCEVYKEVRGKRLGCLACVWHYLLEIKDTYEVRVDNQMYCFDLI